MELLVFGVVILVGGIYIAWLRHTLFWLRKDLEWAKSRRDEACRQWDKFQVWWGEASDERHILRQQRDSLNESLKRAMGALEKHYSLVEVAAIVAPCADSDEDEE